MGMFAVTVRFTLKTNAELRLFLQAKPKGSCLKERRAFLTGSEYISPLEVVKQAQTALIQQD